MDTTQIRITEGTVTPQEPLDETFPENGSASLTEMDAKLDLILAALGIGVAKEEDE